ncbi:MAG TPA: hypothetical protein VFM70_10995 [Salinimicrobium sp.]|nr:hypothetical protein [Salinimicrobium sp.]
MAFNYKKLALGTFVGCFVFVLLIAIGVIVAMFIVFDQNDDYNKTYNEEVSRIVNLPEIKGVIVSDSTIKTPLTNQDAALYLLEVGFHSKLQLTDAARRAKHIRGKTSETYFNMKMLAGYSNKTYILINGKKYPLDFEKCMISKIGESPSENKGFRSRKIKYFNTTAYADSIPEAEKSRNNELKNKIYPFIDKNEYLEQFFASEKKYRLPNVILNEIIFKNGDSIYIKGKIKEGNVIAVF